MSEIPEQVTASFAALKTALNDLERVLQAAITAAPDFAPNGMDHVRAHRPGRASKIESNPELRAFIAARIATSTFGTVAEAVRQHFPPDRQTSVSALHRWWHRTGKHLPRSQV